MIILGNFESFESNEESAYTEEVSLNILDKENIELAKKRFSTFGKVIQNSRFEDDVWHVTDEVHRLNIDFRINYTAEMESYLGYDKDKFILFLKCYITYMFGLHSISSIKEAVVSIKNAAKNLDHPKCAKTTEIRVFQFFELWSNKNDNVIKLIQLYKEKYEESQYLSKNNKRPTKLVDMFSYFMFNDILSGWWDTASAEMKEKYFPVWFWWNITACIPLRVTEFTLTPRECIRGGKGHYVIRLRRTMNKKTNIVKKYTLDSDYKIFTYPCSDRIAKEILWYMSRTEGDSNKDLLFQPIKKAETYTRKDFNLALTDFYESIIDGEFGIKTVKKRDDTEEQQIEKIKPKDTRHIAMINLIMSFGSPTLCKELADHEEIDVSFNYAGNLDEFNKTSTARAYYASKDDGIVPHVVTDTNNNFMPDVVHKMLQVYSDDPKKIKKGWCHSFRFSRGDFSDCVANVSEDCKIGVCENCRFFRNENGIRPSSYSEKKLKERIDADFEMVIATMSSAYRDKYGQTANLLDITSLSYDLSETRIGKLIREELNDGQKN